MLLLIQCTTEKNENIYHSNENKQKKCTHSTLFLYKLNKIEFIPLSITARKKTMQSFFQLFSFCLVFFFRTRKFANISNVNQLRIFNIYLFACFCLFIFSRIYDGHGVTDLRFPISWTHSIIPPNRRVEFQALRLSILMYLDIQIRLQYDPNPSTNARESTTT